MKLIRKYCGHEWHSLINFHKKSLSFAPKQVIIEEGTSVEGIFFIEKGNVKVVTNFGTPSEKILRLAGEGMILGHRALHADIYAFSAIAITSTEISFLPMSVFKNLIVGNPRLALFMMDFLCDELRDAEDRMKNLLELDPKKKIAKILVKVRGNFGFLKGSKTKLGFKLSRNVIANMAGTTYETVIRTLSQFEKDGLVKLEGKDIHIINEDSLRVLAGDSIHKEPMVKDKKEPKSKSNGK